MKNIKPKKIMVENLAGVKEWESGQYDEVWAEEKNQLPEHFRRFDAVYAVIASFVRKSDWVLELGCGTGYFAGAFLHGKCDSFLSVDFSNVAIDVARKNFPELKERFRTFDIKRLHELCYPYTVIIAIEMLEHTDRDIEVLESIAPGALFLFSVPKEEKIKKTPTRHRRSYTYATFEDRYGKILVIDRIFSIGVGIGMRLLKRKMRLDDRHSYVVIGRRRVG